MTVLAKCPECGYVMEADTRDDVVEDAGNHVRSFHGDLAESLSRDDFEGWICESDGGHSSRGGAGPDC